MSKLLVAALAATFLVPAAAGAQSAREVRHDQREINRKMDTLAEAANSEAEQKAVEACRQGDQQKIDGVDDGGKQHEQLPASGETIGQPPASKAAHDRCGGKDQGRGQHLARNVRWRHTQMVDQEEHLIRRQGRKADEEHEPAETSHGRRMPKREVV